MNDFRKERIIEQDENEITEMDDIELQIIENPSDNDYNESEKACANCNSSEAKNQCDKCEKHFCSDCEIKVNGESVLELFKSYRFVNYTCLTTHLSTPQKE